LNEREIHCLFRNFLQAFLRKIRSIILSQVKVQLLFFSTG